MREVSMGPALRIGAMSGAIVLLANVAVSFAIESNALARWLVAPAVGALAAIATLLLQGPPETPLSPLEQMLAQRGEARRRLPALYLRPRPVVSALVVAVLVVGGGGLVATAVARYGMGWVTGNEHGPNRLVSPVTARASGLRVTVDRIEQTPHFTRVSMTVRNESDQSISMPIDGGNCSLIAGDGTTRMAQSFRSDWHESLDEGAVRTGVVTFDGHLPASATRARVTFAHLFGASDGPQVAIVVANLQLLPLS
jgi:hypothetical protein